ncbi:MAG: hypothetical protein ACRDPR_07865 [Nocardioidaceae bacterium]
MAFWRREQAPRATSEFEILTPQQAARLRRLAQESFAEAGVEVVPHAQYLEAGDGRQFGLGSLAESCGRAHGGEDDWPTLVRDHVAVTLGELATHDLVDLAVEDVLASAYLCVVGTSSLPPEWPEWYSYARPLAGDLVELVALDLPDSVALLRDEDVDRIGAERLREAGRRNLLELPIESYETVGEAGGGTMHVVEGASFFTASSVLVFEQLLEATWGGHALPHGAVVALPSRHLMAFHPIEGVDVLDAVPRLTRLVASLFDGSPGGVSPFVYWWRDGRLTQLSGLDDFGRVRVLVGDELTAVLNTLAAEA